MIDKEAEPISSELVYEKLMDFLSEDMPMILE